MSARSVILLALSLVVILGLLVLLVRQWERRAFRLRMLGDILLILLVPAGIIVPEESVLLILLVMGGLLSGGITLRVLAERIGDV